MNLLEILTADGQCIDRHIVEPFATSFRLWEPPTADGAVEHGDVTRVRDDARFGCRAAGGEPFAVRAGDHLVLRSVQDEDRAANSGSGGEPTLGEPWSQNTAAAGHGEPGLLAVPSARVS